MAGSQGSERVGGVIGGSMQAGVMIWGATACDGVVSVFLAVFGGLAVLGTLVRVAR